METPGKGQFQAGVPIAQAAGVNVAANNPVTAAVGNAANAVENVGNLAEALQKEQERQFLAEAELKMSKASADLQLELVGNANPQDHARIAAEKFDSIKADILGNDHYSPRFQREMEQRLNLYTNQKLERITLDARLAQIENGKRLQSALIKQDISSGNFDGARQRTKELKGTYASDEDVQIGLMSIDQVEASQKLQLDVANDPKGTAAKLADESNYPELSPLARQRAKEAADDQAESYRKDEMDKIEERIVTGDFTGADLEVSQYLTETDRKRIELATKQETQPSNETHAKAWATLDQMRKFRDDPSVTPEQYRAMWNEGRSAVLSLVSPKWQGDLKKELNYLSPAGRSPDGQSLGTDYKPEDLAAEGRAIVSRATEANILGRVDKEASPAEKENAYRKAADINREVKRYANSKEVLNSPDPIKAVRQFTDYLTHGDTALNASSKIILPGSGVRLRQLPALPGKGFQVAPGASGSSGDLLPPKTPTSDFNSFLNE